jgi:hypothetical protein
VKKFFTVFTIVFFACGVSLFAQNFAKKGTLELGGSVGFTSTTGVSNGETADESETNFMFNPYVGYFFMNSFEVGLIPSFSTSSFGDQSLSSFGVLLAPAYNFDLGNCWYPFIEGRIGYNTITYDPGIQGVDESTISGLEWGFRGGVKAQVGNNALVNVGVFYRNVTMDPEDWDGDRNGFNQFGIEVGVAIFLY